MKKTVGLLLVLLLCLGMLGGCGQETAEVTKIRLNEVTHSIFYAPMYAAINKGFFKDAGIEVELTNGAGADKVMTALLAGEADIGLMGPEATIYVYNEGKENYIVNFAQLTNSDGSFLVGRQPAPNFSWDDLRGKTVIGGRIGGMPEMVLEYTMKKNGLIPNEDVEVLTNIQFALMGGAFTGGTGDYVNLFEPVASQMEKEGQGYIVASLGKESGAIPYTVFSATKEYMGKSQELIQKFTTALATAQAWVQTAPASEVAEAIKSSFPDTDDELLISSINRYRDQGSWAATPVFTKEAFELLQDIMTEAGQLERRAPYEDLVTNQFAEAAVSSLGGK
ncbi:MAG: ABC transporter substrate-binding protein [Peptococcaceae bacterium]|nr:ABC transporter substrate-binding protein [Peptococcaceae bacterium]